MRKLVRVSLAGTLVAGLLAVAPAASANDADVIKTGACSRKSDWKLKLSPENGRIEVEFEVDQNVVGDVWRVILKHNGERFFRGRRTTAAPSGSFELRRVVDNLTGEDVIVARARNLSTDETCRGTATF